MSFSAINDAVHGVMSVDPEYIRNIKDVVDTNIFQRLRHIKQLGLVNLVFPTANHTRFSHCIGCSVIASKMASTVHLEPELKELTIISALVHDIGHGPFSHTFEKILKNKITEEEINHEDWTRLFLNEFQLPIIEKNLEKITQFVTHKWNYEKISDKGDDHNIAADIVSSSLDADRLDYLMRDSHFCGVSFGKIDLEWLIDKLEKIEYVIGKPRLGINIKALNSAEHFLLARRMMTRDVYHNPVALLYEKLLVTFLEACIKSINSPAYLGQGSKYLTPFLEMSKSFIESTKGTKKDFMQQAYKHYSKIVDYDVWSLIRDYAFSNENAKINQIAYLLMNRKKRYKIYRLHPSNLASKEAHIKKCINDSEEFSWKLILLGGSVVSYKDAKDPLYVKTAESKISTLDQLSPLINTLAEKKEETKFLAVHDDIHSHKKIRNLLEELEVKEVESDFKD